jgi:hypothetical protein
LEEKLMWVAAAIAGSTIVSGVVQSRSAGRAASAQAAAADAGIDEQRRQFDAVQQLLAPYVQTGETALSQQAALVGVGGADAQRQAIQSLEQGPEFQALTRQGEEAILQNAAATGGLRGGNVQGALAQFRPQVLSSLIEQQYGRLGGLANLGQASAVGQAGFGQTTGANVSNLLQQQGAARAGGALAQGQAIGNVFGQFGQLAGAMGTGAIANPFAAQAGGNQFAMQAGGSPTSIRPIARPF